MILVFPSRTLLTSAGLIAGLTAVAFCAVSSCSSAVGQSARPPSSDKTITWDSSVVNDSGATTKSAPPVVTWHSDIDSNAQISPQPLQAAIQTPPIRTRNTKATTPVAIAAQPAPVLVSKRNDLVEKISARNRAAETAKEQFYRTNFERPVKERGPNLLPVRSFPSRITNPTIGPAEVAEPEITLAVIAKPKVEASKVDASIIELLPPAPSELVESNDFPIKPRDITPAQTLDITPAQTPANPSSNESAVPPEPASPFRFASAKKKTQQLPALPPLPGQKAKGANSKTSAKPPSKKKKAPGVLASADSFVLADQPQIGDHYYDENPQVDARAWKSESYPSDFSPDPINSYLPADPWAEIQVYEGKTLNANQRPLVELGRPWYQLGQLSPGSSVLGFHNNLTPQFLVYGDFRSSIASNQLGGDRVTRTAVELNLDLDLKLTGTERFHAFVSPLDNGQQNTGFLIDDNEFIDQFDAQIDFGYFEGDLGAIVGGAIGKTLPFDLPFTVGEIPLVFQNGIWMEDAILGFAATIPARNSPRFDISNMDITFFAGYDQLNSDAFPGDNSAAKIYGIASFIEANNGYWEIDYAFLEDRTSDDRSYHNIGIGFTRRYGRLLSNSTRIIVNAGQSSDQVENTADGVLLLSENSLITGAPSTVVPYLNFFAGFDRPQSAARAAQAGGILRNTGILFESDGMTGYPTLDATANDTFGMALGLNLLPNDFSQQLVVEAAMLGVMGEDANRNAAGDQYGLGVRYQLPLTNSIIFRSDAMVGFRRGDEDINGVRMEIRRKF